MDLEDRGFGGENGVNSAEIAGKMAFWGYRKPNKHKEAKTKPKQPKQK